jgi:Holliday junction resolvase RusA-like endonuclease
MKKRKKKKIMKVTKSYVVEIPLKLPSLNEWINKNRYCKFTANDMKKDIQKDIIPFIIMLPELKHVRINFNWYEGNKRRDLDNICSSKKFILDALVDAGKLKDDNRKYVCGFTDSFYYGKDWKVVLEIQEVEDDSN